jgi:hypothetical protein
MAASITRECNRRLRMNDIAIWSALEPEVEYEVQTKAGGEDGFYHRVYKRERTEKRRKQKDQEKVHLSFVFADVIFRPELKLLINSHAVHIISAILQASGQ